MMFVLLICSGCMGGPSRVHPVDFDPDDSTARAMEEYDTNGDGILADEELDASPPLKSAINQIDTDKDGKISEQELLARLDQWDERRTAVITTSVTVLSQGRPLAGATVTFDPEPFLGESFVQATGETDQYGQVSPSVADKERFGGFGGIPPGLYRVRVSLERNGMEMIPDKYNSETILGQEIFHDAAGMREGIRFNLSRR